MAFRRKKGGDTAPAAGSVASGPQVMRRFRRPWRRASHRNMWPSSVEDGRRGMQARLEVDGFRDAAVGIPEGDWGDILPPAVMAQREIAEGDLAAIGMAWQMDREKLDSAIVKQRRRLKPLDDETVRLAKDLEATDRKSVV